MTKRTLTILIALFTLVSLVLVACGGGGGEAAPADDGGAEEAAVEEAAGEEDMMEGEVTPASEIVMYNWSEYIEPEIYTLFEEEYGIKVVEDNFSSNEELLAKLQGGVTGYALIVPSDYTVSIMIEEGMLAELDYDNIPNASNLDAQFADPPYDHGNVYSMPYQWGTTGIGYLDGQVEEPTSWAAIFDPAADAPYLGRMTMLDDAREAFAAALAYLGYSINTTDEAQLEEAKELLISAKANLAGYDSDTFEDNLASEENLLAHGWSGDFLVAQEDNENILYVVPEEGGVVWVDAICIPVTASPEEKLAAEMFINFLMEPEIGAMLTEYTWFASPNAASNEMIDPELLEDPIVYPPPEVMAKLQFIETTGELDALFTRLWDEVKSQ